MVSCKYASFFKTLITLGIETSEFGKFYLSSLSINVRKLPKVHKIFSIEISSPITLSWRKFSSFLSLRINYLSGLHSLYWGNADPHQYFPENQIFLEVVFQLLI